MRDFKTKSSFRAQTADKKLHANYSRISTMFELGTKAGELEQCLNKKKLHLTAAGARADNLPVTDEGRVRFVSRLNEGAMEHVRTWFYANIEFSDLPDTGHACALLSDPEEEAGLADGERRQLWRSVLACFLGHKTTAAVHALLSQNSAGDKHAGRTADQGIAGPVGALVRTDALAAGPKQDEAGAVTDTLHDSSRAQPSRQTLGIALTERTARRSAALVTVPLRLAAANIGSRERLTVLGQRTNQIDSGAFFIAVTGIVVDEGIVELTMNEASELIPENGSAIGYSNTLNVNSNAAGSLAIWKIEHRSSARSVNYVIQEFAGHTYEVADVPHLSSEPDLVREWIKEVYLPRPFVFPVFRLRDGPIIKLAGDLCETRGADFDTPLLGYTNHPCLKWRGRIIVVEPFGAPDFRYDCAPVRTAVSRLFKLCGENDGFPAITKRQIQNLAARAADASADAPVKHLVARARQHIEKLIDDKECIDELMKSVIELPAVSLAIEDAKREAREEMKREAAAENAELAKLASAKTLLMAEIEKLRSGHKKELNSISREIKHAFDHAGSEGMKTLAAISIFQHTLGISPTHPALQQQAEKPANPIGHPVLMDARDAPPRRQTSVEPNRLSDLPGLQRILDKWDVHHGYSKMLLSSAVAAAAASRVLAVTGSGYAELARTLVDTICGGVDCSVSVSGDMFGISDLMNASAAVGDAENRHAMPLGDFIETQQAAGNIAIVRLRGANRMPPEALIPELLDAGTSPVGGSMAWTDKARRARLAIIRSPVIFLLDFAHGFSVFPVQPPVAWQIPVIDTDAPWDREEEPVGGTSAPVAVMDASLLIGLASGPPRRFDGLCLGTPARAPAASMYGALSELGLDQADARLFTIMAFAAGRADADAIRDAAEAAKSRFSSTFTAYAASTGSAAVFNMGDTK